MAAQDVADGRDAGGVGLLRLLAHAGPFAVADVVFQAHPELAVGDVFLSQGEGAGANGVEFAAQVQNGVHDLDAGEGTEVFAAIADELTGGENAGEALLLDDNERIGLVVLELDVVKRLVLLDEAVFQQ